MLTALAALFFALAGFDAWLTRRRILMYGLYIEQNKAIVTAVAYLGLELGILLGIMVPTTALIALLLWTHFEVGLALFAGFRLKLFLIQLQSFAFEKELMNLKKEMISRGLNSKQESATLPDESPDSKTPSDSNGDNDDRS